MNNRLYIVLFIWSSFLYARDTEEIFLRANDCYEQNDNEQAFALYQSIEHKGPAVWFNMGNCAYKSENYVDALLYWRRAEKHAACNATFTAINNNYKLLEKELGITNTRMGWQRLFQYLSVVPLLWMQLVFLFLWIVLLIVLRRLIRKKRYGILFLYLLCMVLLICFIGIKYAIMKEQRGIVMQKVALYVGPDKNYHVVGTIDKATEVSIDENDGQWIKVNGPHDKGWVHCDNVALI